MTYDFAPLFRTAIGFDRLARLVDNAAQNPAASSYPPYNIERLGDDSYVLTMAVAGFGPDDIDLTVQDNMLIVAGRVAAASSAGEWLHRGIANRAFERRFVLADQILVESADLTNGLLRIAVRRVVPEALKPRRIPVTSSVARATVSQPAISEPPASESVAAESLAPEHQASEHQAPEHQAEAPAANDGGVPSSGHAA
ncbi:Hsp20 family protein [Nguyenibacter vanlangensis]|uniref:Hsp20 family protein n=1 Tax=Nguyenibacter vanlangensis TaxID=1216886 RepID=A0A7Y7IWY3_9PROT|nr:Hsp20 family protein [Nguyenibacter vanlangensis]NVN11898.1 Hsp20 family protein [Nguyenibacter vanlangensis]